MWPKPPRRIRARTSLRKQWFEWIIVWEKKKHQRTLSETCSAEHAQLKLYRRHRRHCDIPQKRANRLCNWELFADAARIPVMHGTRIVADIGFMDCRWVGQTEARTITTTHWHRGEKQLGHFILLFFILIWTINQCCFLFSQSGIIGLHFNCNIFFVPHICSQCKFDTRTVTYAESAAGGSSSIELSSVQHIACI